MASTGEAETPSLPRPGVPEGPRPLLTPGTTVDDVLREQGVQLVILHQRVLQLLKHLEHEGQLLLPGGHCGSAGPHPGGRIQRSQTAAVNTTHNSGTTAGAGRAQWEGRGGTQDSREQLPGSAPPTQGEGLQRWVSPAAQGPCPLTCPLWQHGHLSPVPHPPESASAGRHHGGETLSGSITAQTRVSPHRALPAASSVPAVAPKGKSPCCPAAIAPCAVDACTETTCALWPVNPLCCAAVPARVCASNRGHSLGVSHTRALVAGPLCSLRGAPHLGVHQVPCQEAPRAAHHLSSDAKSLTWFLQGSDCDPLRLSRLHAVGSQNTETAQAWRNRRPPGPPWPAVGRHHNVPLHQPLPWPLGLRLLGEPPQGD